MYLFHQKSRKSAHNTELADRQTQVKTFTPPVYRLYNYDKMN